MARRSRTPSPEDAGTTDTAVLHLGPFDSHGTTRAPYRGHSIEVEHGIPGETVRAHIFGGRRRLGRIVEVLEADPDRVEAPCPYFTDWACGGCQWQHISYEGQVTRKRADILSAMEAEGLSLQVSTVHALEEPWRYRATAGISLGRHAGFRRHRSLAIVPIRDCPISHPLIGRLMARLNELLERGALPDFRGRVRLDVRLTGSQPDDTVLQVLIRPAPDARPVEGDLAALADALIALPIVGGVAMTDAIGGVNVLSGPLLAPTLVEDSPVWLAAPSFFQTNPRLLPALIARLRDESSPLEGRRVADMYAGVGVFGLFLAAAGARVTVVEQDRIAIEAGERTGREWGLSDVRFLRVAAEEALDGDQRFDVVIVDPPRSGLGDRVLEGIVRTRPPLLLYVSCLAQSLARDLRVLVDAGYAVPSLELFDFYPQTYHVELLAVCRITDTPA